MPFAFRLHKCLEPNGPDMYMTLRPSGLQKGLRWSSGLKVRRLNAPAGSSMIQMSLFPSNWRRKASWLSSGESRHT